MGQGMISDDTEHTCMVAQALLASQGVPEVFARSLSWRLRGWLLGLPAGIGMATLRSLIKLCLGWPPHKSGVFSAGNGPAMRSALIGVCFGENQAQMKALVAASTKMTHTDPKAFAGALSVAQAAWFASCHDLDTFVPEACLDEVLGLIDEPELCGLLAQTKGALADGLSPEAFAAQLSLSKGITGYMYHTIPIAFFCWLWRPHEPLEAIEAAIDLGGDTDTVAAIVGAMAGALVGASALPGHLLETIVEWPRSIHWIRSLGEALADALPPEDTGGDQVALAKGSRPVPLFWPGLALRNGAFFGLVLLHGFRRLLPPY